MPCLIDYVEDAGRESVRNQLESAYRAIAEAYLAAGAPAAAVGPSFSDLVRAVNERGAIVNLDPARARSPLVCGGTMDAGEVRNQLRQVEVLVAACDLLGRIGLRATRSCPTQGSTGPDGARVEDLEGPGFVIDAYGGDDVRNNSKAATMLANLRRAGAGPPARRTFLAVRQLALANGARGSLGWAAGSRVRARNAQEKWAVEADVIRREQDEGYMLIEVGRITPPASREAAG